MKILHIVRQFYPTVGGLQNYVLNLAENQVKLGHEVAVVTLNRSSMTGERLSDFEKTDSGISIYRIPYFGSTKYPIAFKVLKYLKGKDLINVHAVDFFADLLAITKIFHRKKLVLTTHGGFFHTPWAGTLKKIYFKVITRFTLMSYNVIIGCSDNDIKIFKKITKRIVKIENGVDVSKLNDLKKNPVKGELLYVGRIDVHKRIDLLIDVVSALTKMGENVILKIAGPDWKGLSPDLKKKAEQNKITERVEFLGSISDEQLLESYSTAQVFLSASEYEGFGISAVEAMASGTICVLNNIPSFYKLLKNKPFGRVVEFNDIENTAMVIKELINFELQEYSVLSEKAREYSKQFDWKEVSKQITNQYQQ